MTVFGRVIGICLLILVCFWSPLAAAQAETVSERVLKAAESSKGKQMWKSGYGLKSGGLGCAASVSNVLKVAGIKHVSSPVTLVMRRQILKGPLKASEYVIKDGQAGPIDDSVVTRMAKPGDVLVAFTDPLPKGNIGPKAHCGVIGERGTVYTNDWNDGIWKNADIHTYFDSYKYIRVLRMQ